MAGWLARYSDLEDLNVIKVILMVILSDLVFESDDK